MKQWKSIPKSKRERLSKKQMERMDKKDTLSDAIQISSQSYPPEKSKKIVTIK
jgi:hypothetical protein